MPVYRVEQPRREPWGDAYCCRDDLLHRLFFFRLSSVFAHVFWRCAVCVYLGVSPCERLNGGVLMTCLSSLWKRRYSVVRLFCCLINVIVIGAPFAADGWLDGKTNCGRDHRESMKADMRPVMDSEHIIITYLSIGDEIIGTIEKVNAVWLCEQHFHDRAALNFRKASHEISWQSWIFRVQVPKDWGQRELVWTITAHGRTEKAYAQLLPEEQILERLIMTRGNLNPGEDDPNQPPSVSIAPVAAANLASPVTLTALVTDDGLPKPHAPREPRPGGIPQAQTNNAVRPKAGLSVTWLEYRGPAKVTFDEAGPIGVTNGQAVTTAHFSAPGTYVLQAAASDGALQTSASVVITVPEANP
jgi:hypothetical protein